jgi:hypothetical protein
MDNLKPFDPADIDESLLRIVSHGGRRYALFPYVDATGAAPEFKSVRHLIDRDQITLNELSELSALVKRRGENAEWFLQFNTPWLVNRSDVENARQNQTGMRRR